jgi:hypothetical protein
MRRSSRAFDRLAGSALVLGAFLAVWGSAGRMLIGQDAPGGPIPPMMVDDEAVVTAEVLSGFRERTEDPGRPLDWFNLGAGLLLAADWEGAFEPTQRALDTDNEDLERAATYNLALARALAGRPPELGGELLFEERRPLLEQAWDGFRWVVRQDPEAADARWNLELVARWLEQEEDPQDDGGGGGGGGSVDADQTDAPATRELSAAEALDLLDVAAEQEQDVQGRRLERNRSRDPVVEKNW